jgi:hypothetical protein
MTGIELLTALKRELPARSDAAVAQMLGLTGGRISQIRQQKTVSARTIATAFARTRAQAIEWAQSKTIQPIVEFFPAEIDSSKPTKVLFDDQDSLYKAGLKSKLREATSVGIYVFYDSQGKAIYAGKTEGQTLWKEMNLALNRRRGAEVQNVYRVPHPERNQEFKTGYEQARQIKLVPVGLWEMVVYFSAYVVHPGMIGEVEALLVRAFANDLLNKRMERFLSSKARK